jgi:hypothetical protein
LYAFRYVSPSTVRLHGFRAGGPQRPPRLTSWRPLLLVRHCGQGAARCGGLGRATSAASCAPGRRRR